MAGRAVTLADAIPAAQSGRITMGVGLGEDATGAQMAGPGMTGVFAGAWSTASSFGAAALSANYSFGRGALDASLEMLRSAGTGFLRFGRSPSARTRNI